MKRRGRHLKDRSFGEWLRFLCHIADLTIVGLEKKASIPRSTLYTWLNDENPPKRDDVRRLTQALQPDYGLGHDDRYHDLIADILLFTAGYPTKRRVQEIEQEISSHALLSLPPSSKAKSASKHQAGTPDRLHTLLSDYSFVHVRSLIDDFVGRDKELREIRLQIDMLLPKGGYLTITGLAGQGKSSIMAKLIEAYGLEETAYHFIPVNPPPDHHISLLLDVMARLLLKHDLPDDWYVADLGLPWLRQSFARLLKQIAGEGKQEVIFIDGLDLLWEDISGERSVSFLPDRLPEGVVLVLSTRPDNTLLPLELYQPQKTYQLSRLSRPDFNLLLERRGGKPDTLQADQLYQVMQGNALYLDLVAKELAYKDGATPEAIIKRVSDNPGNVFTLSMNRLGRSRRDDPLWNNVIKPTLGILLVAREPLAGQHIKHIIGVDADRFSQGVQRLTGLIVADGQDRYTLFHPKLSDYLRQDPSHPQKDYIFALDEEQGWHKRLAAWCEQGGIASLWQKVRNDPIEQERRTYAQRHYITHLYGGYEWQRLFDVLDAGRFGQAKVQNDLSLRSYAQDLDLGRQAAMWEGWTLEEGIALLPCLWRYTLLYSSLSRRADQYPAGAFEMLVYFKRHRAALDLAELLTDPVKKVQVLLRLAKCLEAHPDKHAESTQVYIKVCELVPTIQADHQRTELLIALGDALTQSPLWKQLESLWNEVLTVAATIQKHSLRFQLLCVLAVALARAQGRELADALLQEVEDNIPTVQDDLARCDALCVLGRSFAQLEQRERADAAWQKAKEIIPSLWGKQRVQALSHLAHDFITTQQLKRVDPLLDEIWTAIREMGKGYDDAKYEALHVMAGVLIDAGKWEEAKEWSEGIEDVEEWVIDQIAIESARTGQWERTDQMLQSLKDRYNEDKIRHAFAVALADAQQCERALAVIQGMRSDVRLWLDALAEVGVAFARSGQQEQAEAVWEQIAAKERVSLEEHFANETSKIIRANGLCLFGIALAQGKQWEHTETLWHRAETLAPGMFQAPYIQYALGVACARSQQWERAEIIMRQTPEPDHYASRIARESSWQWPRDSLGNMSLSSLREDQRTLDSGVVQYALATAFARSQQWERATAMIPLLAKNSRKMKALCMLGITLVQANQQERAEAVWAETEALARTLAEEGRVHAAEEVGRDESSEGSILTRIKKEADSFEECIEALCALGAAFAQIQQWKRAEALWTEIEALARALQDGSAYEQYRSNALRLWSKFHAVARVLRENSELEQKWKDKIIWPMREFWQLQEEKFDAMLAEVGEQASPLPSVGESDIWLEEGQRNSVVDRKKSVKALSMLGASLAQGGQWERAEALWREAEAIIQRIGDSFWKEQAMCTLGLALTEAQQWERAEALIMAIPHSDVRAEALCQIAELMVERGEHEELLHMVQRSWCHITARKDAINLLPLAAGLLPLKPDLGLILDEALEGVGTFVLA